MVCTWQESINHKKIVFQSDFKSCMKFDMDQSEDHLQIETEDLSYLISYSNSY